MAGLMHGGIEIISLDCRFAISQHPEVEAKIVDELQRHGLAATEENPNPRQLTYPDLSKLTYLQAVIKVSCLTEHSHVSSQFLCAWSPSALRNSLGDSLCL